MKFHAHCVSAWMLVSVSLQNVVAFQPMAPRALAHATGTSIVVTPSSSSSCLRAAVDKDEGSEEAANPYQDPNYPDLEFVNYDDPEYQVDQGEEFFEAAEDSTEEEIEAMREERRERNDEFQFETYYKEILKEGAEYKGEWTVFRTSTFHGDIEADPNSPYPKFGKVGEEPVKVITQGSRIVVDSGDDAASLLDRSRLLHKETFSPEFEPTADQADLLSNTYWPDEMRAFDFRGQQGNMCVGNAYSICKGIAMSDEKGVTVYPEGPYSEYFAEVGIQDELLRFRIKLDYAILPDDGAALPPLHLRSLTICRETKDAWPRAHNYQSAAGTRTQERLFGPPGAMGGLYDPPPVDDAAVGQYMMLQLEGGATALFPFVMDQEEDGTGWVTSLDWTPSAMRYQVDRKVHAGAGILGLRTLELTEVQGAEADKWRPKDGGSDMRQ